MHLSPSKPCEGKIYYIAKSYRDENGVSTKKNVRRLGTLAEIREKYHVADAWSWATTSQYLRTVLGASSSDSPLLLGSSVLSLGSSSSFQAAKLNVKPAKRMADKK
jgi:hypothetical protein